MNHNIVLSHNVFMCGFKETACVIRVSLVDVMLIN